MSSYISIGFSSWPPNIGDPVSVRSLDAGGIHGEGIITKIENFEVTEIWIEKLRTVLSLCKKRDSN